MKNKQMIKKIKIKKDKYFYIKKTFDVYKKHTKLIVMLIMLTLIAAGLSIMIPILTANMLNYLTNFEERKIIDVSIWIMIIALAMQFINYLINFLYLKIDHKVTFNILNLYCNSLTKLKMQEFDRNGNGVFNARFGEIKAISQFLSYFINVVSVIIANIAFLFYIMVLNLYIGIALLIGLIIMFIIENIRVKMKIDFDRKQRKEHEKLYSDCNELIRGIRDVKVLNLGDNVINRIKVKRNYIDERKEKFHYKYEIINKFISLYKEILIIIILIGAVLLNGINPILPSVLLIVFMYYSRALQAVSAILGIKDKLAENELSCERIYEIILFLKFEDEKFGSFDADNIKGNIEFKKVNFAYDNNKLFDNMNFTIKQNQLTSIVGKSGQGKSTILSLIAKLYDIKDGKILIDGVPINDFSKKSISNNISYITQSPYLFNMSIKENLVLVNKEITQKQIEDACEKAQLADFINSLEDGYDTVIGDNGVMLSGGQRQRLAIARALLKESKIILIDEATSSLDNDSQNKIIKVFEQLKKDHTVVVVAHRLSTIINSDNILVLSNNSVTHKGTHSELIKNSLEYNELYKTENV